MLEKSTVFFLECGVSRKDLLRHVVCAAEAVYGQEVFDFLFIFFVFLECGVRCKDLSRHVVCAAEAVYERKVVGSLALDIDRGDGAGGSGGSVRTSCCQLTQS